MKNTEEKARILIVDDVPANIKALAEMLDAGYKISMATTGQDAIEVVASENVDLILLDVVMPGMDGYRVCEKLKSDVTTAGIPVIFVTGQNEVKDETKGLELGAADYITKPANPAILKARVRNHIEFKRQKDKLESLSVIDGLTGVANRRHFDSFLDQEWRRCIRGCLCITIIMIDIDHFKGYNDHFGHCSGDDCLKKVAASLRNALLRSTDLVARYGGEEFAAILPLAEHQGSVLMAERMRKSVESLHILHPKSDASDYVTVSVGCASMIPKGKIISQTLVDASDKMLYAAKKNGRNQVKAILL